MAGETSDAISAYTQVKMTEAPRLLRMPSKECPEHVDHNFPQQRPEGWDEIDGAVVLFDMNLYGHPLAGLLWGRKFEEVLFEKVMEKVPTLECLYVHMTLVLFF